MNNLSEFPGELKFKVTVDHECSYLPEKQARTLFVDPEFPLTMAHYSYLAKAGFRRSGDHVYRPFCRDCGLCIPVRIPAASFKPDRSQRRVTKSNQDLVIREHTAEFDEQHYQLYRKYMQARHKGGGMDKDSRHDYEHLLKASWSESILLAFYLEDNLIMIAVTDVLEDGLSAVYTFFDPEYAKRSLGVYGILSQLEQVKKRRLEYLYLGYWNPQSNKMSYKSRYQPLEFFNGEFWQPLNKTAGPFF